MSLKRRNRRSFKKQNVHSTVLKQSASGEYDTAFADISNYKLLSDEEFGTIRAKLLTDRGELCVIKELKQLGARQSDWHWPTQIATYLAYELHVRGENASVVKGCLLYTSPSPRD